MTWQQMEDLLLATTMALVILIPVIGLTVRFTLAPVIDRFLRFKAGQTEGLAQEVGELRGELAAVHRHVEQLETDLHRLTEVREFDRQLRATTKQRRG